MKNILNLLLLLSFSAGAQITQESAYVYSPGNPLHIVNFTAAGYKYCVSNSSQVVLYNLNHSVYRTIPIPAQQAGAYGHAVTWVSDQLFDTDPLDVEYLLTFHTANNVHTRIYDESGMLLFSRDSFFVESGVLASVNNASIQHTSGGTKMLMTGVFGSSVAVYSLPGVLPCIVCDQGVMSGIQPQPSEESDNPQQLPYPNPAQSTTTIPYTLPEGISTGTIIIYDMTGRVVKRFEVTNAFTSLALSAEELADGTYSYALEAGQSILPGRQFVIAK